MLQNSSDKPNLIVPIWRIKDASLHTIVSEVEWTVLIEVNATMINLGLEKTVTTINLGLILDGDQSIVSQGDFEHTLENIRLEPAHLEVNATYE